MHHPRLLTVLFTLAVVIGLAATYAPEGMVRFYGDTTLTNLVSGQVYFNTSNSTLWAGGVSSNPVKVGDAAWSNSVTASVTNGLASTNFVNSAVAPLADTNFVNTAVANRAVTNAWNTLSLVITNSHPGTNAWLRSDDGTNLYWQAAP
jgi:hypothetical protein